MILFPNEEHIESTEADGKGIGVMAARCLAAGKEKTKEPLHRTKKLRGWPTETTRREIYLETMVQETGRPPDRASLELWREKEAQKIWDMLTEDVPKGDQNRIFYEYAICHIAKMIANTIHLEKMYTTLRPIGLRQWEISSQGLRSLADENALLALTEKTGNPGKKIPEWIKGAILYLSLQGSKRGAPDFNHTNTQIPDLAALKSAADWCLGSHLKIRGQLQTLEETTAVFEHWQTRRAKIDLTIVQLRVEDIPKEEDVPPTEDRHGNELPWNLAWRILPIMEEEIRELGTKVLKNEAALHALGESFKKKVMDRWVNSIAKRGYIREFEGSQGVGERWRTRTLVLNPIDNYVSTRILGNTPIRLIAKTETAWQLLTEDLPEENFS